MDNDHFACKSLLFLLFLVVSKIISIISILYMNHINGISTLYDIVYRQTHTKLDEK